jgi:hypothetical protein
LRHRQQLLFAISFAATLFFSATPVSAQDRGEEIVANLAGGRVIVHVTRDAIVFAAIDQPIEANSIPPRIMGLDSGHIGILLGASEWRLPADPKPVRLDRDFARVAPRDPRYETSPDEAEPDLDAIGVAFLEKLRPLAAQLHRKLDFKPEDALFELVIIGYAPNDYGPEVWTAEYRLEQEEIATRGEFWQTRVLRPRFTQLYPPEKHAAHTIVEARYPDTSAGPTLLELIDGNDPRIAKICTSEPRFAKVQEAITRGQAQKAVTVDASDFMRAVLPLIAGNARFFLGRLPEQGEISWLVPPEEPVEKAKEDKNRPPEAPSLRRKPQP